MARIVSGTGIHVDYTPSGAVANGDIVVQGDMVGIADADIAANTKGALVVGGVVIAVPKDTGSADSIAVGQLIYWDSGNEVATTTAGANKKLGLNPIAAAASDTEVYIVLGSRS